MPELLPAFVEHQSASIRYERYFDQARLTNAQLKAELQDVQVAALLLEKAFSNASTNEYLRAAKDAILPTTTLMRLLDDLSERAQLGIELIPASSSGVIKAGRGKKSAVDMPSPKAMCAAFIVEVWTSVHGKPPGPQTLNAAMAANILWRLVFPRDTSSYGSNPVSGWRSHFNRVLTNDSCSFLRMKRARWRADLAQASDRNRVPWHLGSEEYPPQRAN